MKNSPIGKAIRNALGLDFDFYAYKLPDKDDFHFGIQIDREFKSNVGFKIMPFSIKKHPGKTIYQQLDADSFVNQVHEYATSDGNISISSKSTDYTDYLNSINRIISSIKSGSADKIVMSKIIVESHSFNAECWSQLFFNLAGKYPNAFTFLFYTKETGAWMGATPEILGTYNNRIFQTMALAGTRKSGTIGIWDEKDIGEQEYVVNYIRNIITINNLDYQISPKFTKPAGVVEHICNIFTVNACSISQAERMIDALHPTPAVAGLPKDKALDLIGKFELHDREYYGGYLGPFRPEEFNYFVNLRSMKFDRSKYEIFVGGGIVKESIPESEWNETEFKSQTLLSLINTLKKQMDD